MHMTGGTFSYAVSQIQSMSVWLSKNSDEATLHMFSVNKTSIIPHPLFVCFGDRLKIHIYVYVCTRARARACVCVCMCVGGG